ncbi:MAG: hypothetical protein IJX49_07285, partial [Clostridia bacterium]|nr:hypothetical protein [Clostridia bacterium]
MKKSTKNLLSFLIASAFVGASAGAVAVTINSVNSSDVVTASAENAATELSGTFTPSFETGAYASEATYDRTAVCLTSSVAFYTGSNVYLNDHKDSFASIDLMDYIYVNGKSARAIYDDRGGDAGAAENYPNSKLVIPTWAPITVNVMPSGSGTVIRVEVDRRYIPAASLEVTLKACEFELNGAAYKVSEDQAYKMTVGEIGAATSGLANLKIVNASEANETAVAPGFARAAKWADEGNYYKFMVQGPAENVKMNAAHGNGKWLMDNLCYFHDYMLVNGRSITEIELEDYNADFDFTGAPNTLRNYTFCVMPQVFVNESDNYLTFNVNKDWAAAKGLNLENIQFTIKAGMPYYGSDGVVYRTNADFTTPADTVTGGAFDASRVNYGVSESGIGIYEIGTSGLDMQTPNCNWHLTQLDTPGGLNEGDEGRIFLNDKSIAEWNATDDSTWSYTEEMGWPNAFHSGFHKPIVMNFATDKLIIFVHPELMKTFNTKRVEIEIPEEFIVMNAELTKRYTIPTLEKTCIYAEPVDITVITGNPRTNPESVSTISTKYGETVTLETPTAEGKVFTGWTDV